MIDNTMLLKRIRIEPQTGSGLSIGKSQRLRIIDVKGGQVCDLFCFARNDVEESLSSGHTNDYNGKLFLTKGDILYSNRSNEMFSITKDQVGKHIMLYAPCSQEMFKRSYGITKAHPNCLDNLITSLKRFGIRASQITIPFNIFMNIDIAADGKIKITPPLSKAGDAIELRAEMDMVVGLTSCSAGTCNNFQWTPIDVEIYSE